MSALKPLKRPQPRRRRTAGHPTPDPARRSPSLAPFYVLLAVIALGGGAFLLLKARGATPLPPSDVPVAQAVRPLDAPTGQTPEGYWYKGRPDAPVTVIEYADFQCPSCGAFFRSLEGQIDRQYIATGKVRLVYHDFPLPMHPNAIPAAAAARCAGDQGQFWPMHDLLFSRQREWEHDTAGTAARRFTDYAGELGLDRDAFNRCLTDSRYDGALKQAVADATRRGIGGTPTFVIAGDEGRQINAADLLAALDAALKARGQ